MMLPTTGMAIIIMPTRASVIAAACADNRPNQNRLVAIAMSLTRSDAPSARPLPTIDVVVARLLAFGAR